MYSKAGACGVFRFTWKDYDANEITVRSMLQDICNRGKFFLSPARDSEISDKLEICLSHAPSKNAGENQNFEQDFIEGLKEIKQINSCIWMIKNVVETEATGKIKSAYDLQLEFMKINEATNKFHSILKSNKSEKIIGMLG